MLFSRIRAALWPPYEWRWHQLDQNEVVVGFDGAKLSGWVMRRVVNGEVQYRAYTKVEMEEAEEESSLANRHW